MLTRRTFSTPRAPLWQPVFSRHPRNARKPNPALENLGGAALREAKKLKATYCDIRIIRTQQQFLSVRLNPERGNRQNARSTFRG